MKIISTTVKTGDKITIDGKEWIVGTYSKGKIKLTHTINKTSCITQEISTKTLNKSLANINNSI